MNLKQGLPLQLAKLVNPYITGRVICNTSVTRNHRVYFPETDELSQSNFSISKELMGQNTLIIFQQILNNV